MKPKEKREAERRQSQEKRRREILRAAQTVFSTRGIEKTNMTDIAEEAEIGIATLYRYFNTKSELVIETGKEYCRSIIEGILLSREYDQKNGRQKIDELTDLLIDLCLHKGEFITFLQQFDFYFSFQENRHPRLAEFEEEISRIFPLWTEALEKGRTDGSLRPDISVIDTAALIFRSFLSLQQRVLTRDFILSIDNRLDREKQMFMLKEMVLCYISQK